MWFRFAIYKNVVLFSYRLALPAAVTVANIKIGYDAKIPQFAIFGTRVIYVFYSIYIQWTLTLSERAVAVVVDPIQSVKGKVSEANKKLT